MDTIATLILTIPIITVTILAIITHFIAQETIDRLLYNSLKKDSSIKQIDGLLYNYLKSDIIYEHIYKREIDKLLYNYLNENVIKKIHNQFDLSDVYC